MNAWLDKPDGDGLWWKASGDRVCLCVVDEQQGDQGRFSYVCDRDGKPWVGCPAYDVDEGSKWLRGELTKPELYQPPKPPKVEWFTAVGGKRFVLQTKRVWIAFDSDGTQCNCGPGSCSEVYGDIVPMESPP